MSDKSKAQRKADYDREHAVAEEHRAETLAGPAGTVSLNIGGQYDILAGAREFGTGSYGWYANDKITLPDGRRIQVGVTATVVNSGPFKP